MIALPASTLFSLKRVQEMLGLSRTVLNGLIDAGFVTPTRGARNEFRFSFQDLMILRTAHALKRAGIPPRKILRSLAKLRASLPAELPLTGLRITAVGSDVAVRDRSGQWHAESGQLLMDFEVARVDGTVAFMPAASLPNSTHWFSQGEMLEASDKEGAEQAYRKAIELAPDRVQPYLNLGVMLCESDRCAEAVALYKVAIEQAITDPVLEFNQAVALERLDLLREAVASYERALALDESFADAHYNLGALFEKTGDSRGALRHLNAYRRLQRTEGA